MKVVNTSVHKKESRAILTGKPAYVEDLAPRDALVVKVVRCPYANAIIKDIDIEDAMAIDGVVAVFSWKDVDQDGPRYTNAGQTYPEPSPHDRLILDRHMRFSGDAAAIVAAETEAAAELAVKAVKIEYEVLEAVLDIHEALDSHVIVHPEENWESLLPVGADRRRNLVAHSDTGEGDVDAVFADCDVVLDRTFHTKANSQTPMETFRAYASMDAFGRLNVVSSTQIIFHARRHVAAALGIPKSMVRIIKPRVGGGFGAKQSSVADFYPAFVTWKTGKPSKIIYTREEAQIAGSPRHEMEVRAKVGADRDGKIRAIEMYTLSNTGAYSEHGPTTVDLSGHKAISLYRDLEAFRFHFDVVYTNRQASGAYRGYGGTQGTFALETTVNELADTLGIDRFEIRNKNMTREGDIMPAYFGEENTSCKLDDCLARAKEMIGWDDKYPVRDMGNGKVRAVGIGMNLQGSCITQIDVGEARIKLNDEGFYVLFNGAGEMGQGCDTILPQIAAEVLQCDVNRVITFSGDTDASPYDSGSYASSTTFVTGKAVEECAKILRERIMEAGASLLKIEKEEAQFDGEKVYAGEKSVSLTDIVYGVQQCGHEGYILEAAYHHTGPSSPPPYIAGAAEVEIDKLTGEAKVIEYDVCVDCGTTINPNLARIQVEGGLMQGIGMTLWEDVNYDRFGRQVEDSFMKYKIPTRIDTPVIKVEFADSYEPNGPFGAKSIGEVVLNTPLSAITDAIYNGTGKRFRSLPITPEMIAMGIE